MGDEESVCELLSKVKNETSSCNCLVLRVLGPSDMTTAPLYKKEQEMSLKEACKQNMSKRPL